MWEQDWALLGIEPTTELGAIKKAYALKLKVTRPDDDAEAYQALRAAYERAQQWAKWERQEASEHEKEHPDEPAAPLPEPVEVQTPPPAVTPAPATSKPVSITQREEPQPAQPRVEPRTLIDELASCWQRRGSAALLQAWATVRHQLDQQPLSRQAEFSEAFAQWALSQPQLPDALLKALDQHFGWLTDFRTARLLGPDLTQALHEQLGVRLHPESVDPMLRALAEPLQGVAALRTTGRRKWLLQLMCFLLQPTLARGQSFLGEHWLRQFGLDAEAQRWMSEFVLRGQWLRVGVASALCMAAAVLMFDDVFIAIGHMLTWLIFCLFILMGGLFGGAVIGIGPKLTTARRRLALPLDRWRRHNSQPWLGLVWLLFAAWLFHLDATQGAGPQGTALSLLPDWALGYAAWGFAVAGLLLAWPLDLMHGCVLAALSALVGHLLIKALGGWLPPQSCVLIGAVWLLAGAAVHEERLGLTRDAPVRWLVRPVLNSLALANRWTYAAATLPLTVAVAWAVLNDGHASALRLFLVWVLSVLAVGWLQTQADAWCLKRLRALRHEQGD